MDDSGDRNQDDLSAADLWPMGAVSQRTGLTEHTLRAWERRFGFPDPIRLPSGHRRYPKDQVKRLLLINRVLSCGHRAGNVVAQPVEELERILRESESRVAATPEHVLRRWLDALKEAALHLDTNAISTLLLTEASRLGAPRFLRERAVPLLTEVGDAWARGELAIRHEHLLSELLEDCLRALRSPLETTTGGRPVVLACLPDEQHSLGLQLAALEIAVAGRQLRILGARSPLDELAASARTVNAAAVALSISVYVEPETVADQLAMLRRQLPPTVALWIGGGGVAMLPELPAGIQRLSSLDDLSKLLADADSTEIADDLD